MGAIALCLSTGHLTQSKAEELSVANFVPPQHHTNSFLFKWFGEELEARSGGSLKLKVYPAGQLGAGPVQQYKRAVEGVADITFGLQAYTPAIFPKSMLIIPPGVSTTAKEATERLLAVYDEHRAIIDELAGETFSLKGAESFDGADAKSLEIMQGADQMAKVTQITVSDEERAKMDAAVQKGLESIFADYDSRGITNAREIYNAINQR